MTFCHVARFLSHFFQNPIFPSRRPGSKSTLYILDMRLSLIRANSSHPKSVSLFTLYKDLPHPSYTETGQTSQFVTLAADGTFTVRNCPFFFSMPAFLISQACTVIGTGFILFFQPLSIFSSRPAQRKGGDAYPIHLSDHDDDALVRGGLTL